MPKFRVTVERSATATYSVTVSAADEDHAAMIAEAKVRAGKLGAHDFYLGEDSIIEATDIEEELDAED